MAVAEMAIRSLVFSSMGSFLSAAQRRVAERIARAKSVRDGCTELLIALYGNRGWPEPRISCLRDLECNLKPARTMADVITGVVYESAFLITTGDFRRDVPRSANL